MRSERFRTLGSLLAEVCLTDPFVIPICQLIARVSGAIFDRGARVSAIAKHFGVDHHTAALALRWNLGRSALARSLLRLLFWHVFRLGALQALPRKVIGWWTRTQRIRTLAKVPFQVAILRCEEPPVYQRIAPKAVHLRELGLRNAAIARRLGVTDKTVAKAIRWLKRMSR